MPHSKHVSGGTPSAKSTRALSNSGWRERTKTRPSGMHGIKAARTSREPAPARARSRPIRIGRRRRRQPLCPEQLGVAVHDTHKRAPMRRSGSAYSSTRPLFRPVILEPGTLLLLRRRTAQEGLRQLAGTVHQSPLLRRVVSGRRPILFRPARTRPTRSPLRVRIVRIRAPLGITMVLHPRHQQPARSVRVHGMPTCAREASLGLDATIRC